MVCEMEQLLYASTVRMPMIHDIHTHIRTYHSFLLLLFLPLLSLVFSRLTQFENGCHLSVLGHWKSFIISQGTKGGLERSSSRVKREGGGRREEGGRGGRKDE